MTVGTFVCAECERRLGYAGSPPVAGPDGPLCPTCATDYDDADLDRDADEATVEDLLDN
jgi:hypothetical protein